ncbi:MAG: hypothetical protein LBR68_06905 [Lachnoclostridium sp.]|jgi:hypothetical protein|nr:hypothetical protein [Lachnoclostridium sp.]
MKKAKAIILVIILLLNTYGCNRKSLSIEQSKINFVRYQTAMEKLLIPYNYRMKEIVDKDYEDSDGIIREFVVKISDTARLHMRYVNSSGVETFFIDYVSHIPNKESMNKTMNIPLYVKLVNVISGMEITEESCYEFLNASEEEYPPEGYGTYKFEDEIIRKIKWFDFFGDYGYEYALKKDFEEILTFGGETKQLID